MITEKIINAIIALGNDTHFLCMPAIYEKKDLYYLLDLDKL